MPLTPIDVQQKTFGTALRGYDLDEVDDFLDEVVTTLKENEQRLRDAQERIAQLESEVTDRGDAEGAIARALVAAQRSADTIVEEAQGEAERILAEARTRADELVAERDEERARLLGEIDSMRRAISQLRTTLRSLAEAVSEDLATMDAAVEEAAGRLQSPPEEPVTSPWSGAGLWGDEVDEAGEGEDGGLGAELPEEPGQARHAAFGPAFGHDAGAQGPEGGLAEEAEVEAEVEEADVEEAEAAVSIVDHDEESGERVPRPWEEV